MGFMVDTGSAASDLPYLQAAVDQAGRYLAGKYAAARDVLGLAVRDGPRVGKGRRALVLIAGSQGAAPEPPATGRLPAGPRPERSASRRDRAGYRALRRAFLG